MIEFLTYAESMLSTIPYLLEIVKTISIVIIAYFINKLFFQKWIFNITKKMKLKKNDIKPIRNIISLIIYAVALMSVLGVWGLEGSVTGLLAGAGFAGIVVGFAAQDIMGNFISGLILILDKKFNVGDVVEISGISGVIEDINVRTSSIMTWDGELVIIPNSKVANEIVKNRSLQKPLVRIRLPIGVDYGTNMEKLIEICDKVMGKMKEIERDPKPQVVFEKFADSSFNFEMRFWINMEKVSPPAIKTKISIELNKALKKAKIKIPYPHIEVIRHK